MTLGIAAAVGNYNGDDRRYSLLRDQVVVTADDGHPGEEAVMKGVVRDAVVVGSYVQALSHLNAVGQAVRREPARREPAC